MIESKRRQTTVTANRTQLADARGIVSPCATPAHIGGISSVHLVIPDNGLEFFLKPEVDVTIRFDDDTGVYLVSQDEHMVFQTGTYKLITITGEAEKDIWFGFNLGSVY